MATSNDQKDQGLLTKLILTDRPKSVKGSRSRSSVFSKLSLRLPKVWPTEIIIVHLSLIMVMLSSYFAGVSTLAWRAELLYVAFALAAYWYIYIFVRKSGFLVKQWREQVQAKDKTRVSVGVLVILLDTFHILIFLFSLLLISSNILLFTDRAIVGNWTEAICLTLKSTGIDITCNSEPKTITFRVISLFNYFVGIIFLSFWVSIFMKAFDAVLQFFKND